MLLTEFAKGSGGQKANESYRGIDSWWRGRVFVYDIIKNLYYVTLIAMLLQFMGLYEPFAVLFGLTLLYFAVAELFMKEELDRLRRMMSISYTRRQDVSIAFIAMTLCFGAYYLSEGMHMRLLRPYFDWILGIGSLGALYLFLHQYLPTDRGRKGPNLRSVR